LGDLSDRDGPAIAAEREFEHGSNGVFATLRHTEHGYFTSSIDIVEYPLIDSQVNFFEGLRDMRDREVWRRLRAEPAAESSVESPVRH
jgi:hypothetical protein